jgi:hypothetical protein
LLCLGVWLGFFLSFAATSATGFTAFFFADVVFMPRASAVVTFVFYVPHGAYAAANHKSVFDIGKNQLFYQIVYFLTRPISTVLLLDEKVGFHVPTVFTHLGLLEAPRAYRPPPPKLDPYLRPKTRAQTPRKIELSEEAPRPHRLFSSPR